MNVLGIRCSNKNYTFAIVTGTKGKPKVLECETISYPTGFAKPQSFKWLLQEIHGLIEKHNVKKIALKRFEGRFRDKRYEERIEHEAIIYLAAANCGVKPVCKKGKSTIAKDLGLKGRGRYLSTSLDTSLIIGYSGFSDNAKEAILVGWSELV